MKNVLKCALLVSALMVCTQVVIASEQTSVMASDMDWMKQQQRSLEDFKQRLQGNSMQLPAEQQALIEKLQGDIGRQQAEQQVGEKRTFPAMYFVSLGLPREGLLQMLKDANRYGIPATLRGLVNNDLRQTASAMFELAKEDKNIGVQIDPTLYTEYHIKTIPSLVVTCPGRYDVIRGSLPLKEALERVAKDGDCAETAKRLLKEAQ
ncbi:TPA: type-F conjugative transfer system pilin assembly protein TrbC [Citrobacter farmeri]|uniref:type-F conjugative transfer system pilin assembly protein TrbC n=1 Tax=Citrobacter TaxID=544 RepID=UPI000E175D4F|nr:MULTISPECIES: type-F conjugative transfer system pilin assembly protein TrbC [Citrobacter]EKQ0626971.1 type-F conjugative transfer system pilin assembly protein TrbC [Salmonella enterica]MDT7072813.1 type-F conjugative transfer system pilin assembly protein TrbC [Citrobacter amalonaticus]MEC3934075.1 type-F conjugative transfer system pilin assembly protein TrbC [Citrobacter farmeri]UBI23186.1 type-F conjugative transfer system pilin assembly protein TrbC [Citrobacter amalonaticus]STA62754.